MLRMKWSWIVGGIGRISRLRMLGLLVLCIALTCLVARFKPELLPVSIYKLSLITTAGWLAFWFDVWAYPYGRPGNYTMPPISVSGPSPPDDSNRVPIPGLELVFAAAMIRRTLLIVGAMLAVAMGA